MTKRSKRRAARLRLKRIAFFVSLAALAPLWLRGWPGEALPDVRGARDAAQRSSFARPAAAADASRRMFLAATGRGDGPAAPAGAADDQAGRPDGVILSVESAARDTPALAPAPRAEAPKPAAIRAPHPAAAPPPPAPARPAPRPRPVVRSRTRTIRMLVTAYCPCRKCCPGQSDGITASGKSVYANGSPFVAADTRLLGFGTKVSVPGYYGGSPVPVYDRGGRIKGRRLDVFFLSHSRAKKWGARWLNVTVYE